MDRLRADIVKALGVKTMNTATVKKGSNGDVVAALQTALAALVTYCARLFLTWTLARWWAG